MECKPSGVFNTDGDLLIECEFIFPDEIVPLGSVRVVHVLKGEGGWLVLGPIRDPEYNQGRNTVSIYMSDPWVSISLVQPSTLGHPKHNPRRIYCGTPRRQSTVIRTGFRVLSIFC